MQPTTHPHTRVARGAARRASSVTKPVAEPLSRRARQIVAIARELLEQEGPAALTVCRLAERLGIRARSLYKHLPDRAGPGGRHHCHRVEDAAAAFETAVDDAADRWPPSPPPSGRSRAHPHLYRLTTGQPLPASTYPPASRTRRRTAATGRHNPARPGRLRVRPRNGAAGAHRAHPTR
jgi:AcrR family transcriptional regulator